jgi:hypothetical protein
VAKTRKGYPAIPAKIWLALRERFYNSPPKGEVTTAYLTNALGLGTKVATNALPSLKAVGLLDESNRLTPLASKWREDSTYAEACREIVDNLYPQALKDISPPDAPDHDAAQRWFMSELNSGAPRANQLAAFYVMIAKGDISAATDRASRLRRNGASTDKALVPTRPARVAVPVQSGKAAPTITASRNRDRSNDGDGGGKSNRMPAVSIAIQVYIDKGMDAAQIDKVFESMARHLYDRD